MIVIGAQRIDALCEGEPAKIRKSIEHHTRGLATGMRIDIAYFFHRGFGWPGVQLRLYPPTLVNAEIVGQRGLLGEIVAGAFADLLVVDGDPTSDLGVFQNDGARIPEIMKGGRFVKNAL